MSLKSAAVAALIATLLFPVAVVVLNIVQSPPYDPVSQPASQLALGTGGWIMVVGFCGLAIGTLLVALLLARTLGSWRSAPVVLLLIAGVLGFVPAAVQTDAKGATLTTHGLVHNLTGVVTFILYVAAMITAAVKFNKSDYWRRFRRPTVFWAAAGVVAFLLIVALGKSNLFGLAERIALVVFISWLLAVSLRAALTRLIVGQPPAESGLRGEQN